MGRLVVKRYDDWNTDQLVIRIQFKDDFSGDKPMQEYRINYETLLSVKHVEKGIRDLIDYYAGKFNVPTDEVVMYKLDYPPPTGTGKSTNWDRMRAELKDKFPVLQRGVHCPVKICKRLDNVGHIIIHLNDIHKWSREAIAKWVDSLG